jgi:hypothetical protein
MDNRSSADSKKEFYRLLEISTPIAIFTTAYARMHMASLKIEYQDHLYYSNTDSLVLDCPLPDNIVGDQLGQFKLERKVSEGVFLAPKVYGLSYLDDKGESKVIIKNKGYALWQKHDLTLDHLKDLLNKDSSLKLRQDK